MLLLGLIAALLMCLGGLALFLIVVTTVFGELSLAENFMIVATEWGPMGTLITWSWALTAFYLILMFIGWLRTPNNS